MSSSNCYLGFVRPNEVAQLSGTERTSIFSATTIYNAATLAAANSPTKQLPDFRSGTDYIAYKKALVLVSALPPTVGGRPVRPLQTPVLSDALPTPGCGPAGGGGTGGGGGGLGGGGGGGGLGGGGGGLG
jgi:hypothetical protein